MTQRSIAVLTAVGVLTVIAPAITSCTRQPAPLRAQQANASAESPVAAVARSEPWNLLSGSSIDIEREGDSSRAVAATVTNHSSARLGGIEGFVTYQNAEGADMSTVHFTADGDLAPMETGTIRITADAIPGVAGNGRVRITKAEVVTGE